MFNAITSALQGIATMCMRACVQEQRAGGQQAGEDLPGPWRMLWGQGRNIVFFFICGSGKEHLGRYTPVSRNSAPEASRPAKTSAAAHARGRSSSCGPAASAASSGPRNAASASAGAVSARLCVRHFWV